MKSKKLRDAFGYIDDKFLNIKEDKTRKKSKVVWLRWGGMAACLCIVIAITLIFMPFGNDNELVGSETSETYASLDELLKHLSKHDGHNEDKADANGSRSVGMSSMQTSKNTVTYGDTVYQINKDYMVSIYKNGEHIGDIETASCMFLQGDYLILVKDLMSGGTELDPEISSVVKIYDISNPGSPFLMDTFTQLGSLTACYMLENDLYLITSDGVCACGWSRLDDVSGYVPQLSHGDAKIQWTDEEIKILGSPSSVNYVAVTIIDTETKEVAEKQAFYGNIEDVFYGENWLVFSTETYSEKLYLHPNIYVFTGKGMEFAGKVSTAEMFGLEESVKLNDNTREDGDYPYITSIFIQDNKCCIVGKLNSISEGNLSKLMAITYDLVSKETQHEELTLADESLFNIDDVRWEDSRAIVTISASTGEGDDWQQYSRMIFVEFIGSKIEFYPCEFTNDTVAGIDMIYWYGSPYGYIDPFIYMGNGIYLRYNEWPNGLDIYDLSDSKNPVCLYRTEGDIPKECRFDFESYVYDENTFGILMLTPDDEGDYRNLTYTWQIYSIDLGADEPFELIKEIAYPIAGEDYSSIIY